MDVGTGVMRGRTFARRAWATPVVFILATAMLVTGTYLWQHAQVIQGRSTLDRANVSVEAARGRVTALTAEVGELRGRVESLQQRMAALKADATKAEADAAAAVSLSDGTYPTYIRGVDVAGGAITVDVVQAFTGDAAVAAAIQDGIRPRDAQYLPAYIRNENDRLRTLSVAPDVSIRLMGECDSAGDRNAALTKLARATTPFSTTYYYSVTIAGGEVHRIVQHLAISAC
jgi:hypothetical protein